MSEDRSASFVELFFDLVFVFGVTQVVSSVHGHLDYPTLWRASVVLLLLWWAWSQYTWLAGHVDFDELGPRVVMLVATAGTFLLAVAVQGAWGDDGAFFGLGYFGVMALSGFFYWHRSKGTDGMAGVLLYVPRMLAGAAFVLVGGFFDGHVRIWMWVAGVAITLFSAFAAGRYEFKLSESHFAERHGLFVIIVLGEALIAIGVGTLGHDGTVAFYVAGTAALVTVLAMWWGYFDWPMKIGEHALKDAQGVEMSRLARDAYTFAHYPLVAGVVLFAVGTEELLAHPALATPDAHRSAIAVGLTFFMLSIAYSVWRWTGKIAWERLIFVAVLLASAALLGSLSGAVFGGWVALLVVASLTVETVRYRAGLEALRSSA